MAAVCLLLLPLCSGALSCADESAAPIRPNLLLISVDTLRHDRLGFRGYPVPTSPNLDEMAQRGTVFTNAYSQSGWTLPSMATIMTGRHPNQHGAIDFNRQIDAELPTMATFLRERGYDTRGFVSHVLLTARYGFDRGFSQFDARIGPDSPVRILMDRTATYRTSRKRCLNFLCLCRSLRHELSVGKRLASCDAA